MTGGFFLGGLQYDFVRLLVRMCKHRCLWSSSHFLKFTFEASDFFLERRRRRVASWLFREIFINQPRLCRVSWVNIWAREAAEWAGGRTCRWWKALDLIQHENAPSVCSVFFFFPTHQNTLHVFLFHITGVLSSATHGTVEMWGCFLAVRTALQHCTQTIGFGIVLSRRFAFWVICLFWSYVWSICISSLVIVPGFLCLLALLFLFHIFNSSLCQGVTRWGTTSLCWKKWRMPLPFVCFYSIFLFCIAGVSEMCCVTQLHFGCCVFDVDDVMKRSEQTFLLLSVHNKVGQTLPTFKWKD